MSIALTTKVKELEARLKEALERIDALEKAYNTEQLTEIDPPKRRGRPPKYENV